MPTHLLFLDCTAAHTEFQLPQDLSPTETITGACLRWWNVEGLAEATGDYTTSGFYIQVKFDGCLEIRTLAGNARPDMLQVPVRSFNGWGISPGPIPVHLNKVAPHTRFSVDLFTEGAAPSRLAAGAGASLRVLLWLEVTTTQ